MVGAVPAHLVAGIWGTLAASIVAGASFGIQILGVAAVGAFVFAVSWVLWRLLDMTIKVSRAAPGRGVGSGRPESMGIEAYPEFVLMPEPFDDED